MWKGAAFLLTAGCWKEVRNEKIRIAAAKAIISPARTSLFIHNDYVPRRTTGRPKLRLGTSNVSRTIFSGLPTRNDQSATRPVSRPGRTAQPDAAALGGGD